VAVCHPNDLTCIYAVQSPLVVERSVALVSNNTIAPASSLRLSCKLVSSTGSPFCWLHVAGVGLLFNALTVLWDGPEHPAA